METLWDLFPVYLISGPLMHGLTLLSFVLAIHDAQAGCGLATRAR